MLKDSDIETIRQSVSAIDIAGMYGYKPTRARKIICPFHKDSNPSMQLYPGDKGYYCFVCGAGGDVIDFVRRHDGLDFEPAVRRIAEYFGIPISDGAKQLSDADRKAMDERKAQRMAAEEAAKRADNELKALSDEIRALELMQGMARPMTDVWCMLSDRVDVLNAEWESKFERRKR